MTKNGKRWFEFDRRREISVSYKHSRKEKEKQKKSNGGKKRRKVDKIRSCVFL